MSLGSDREHCWQVGAPWEFVRQQVARSDAVPTSGWWTAFHVGTQGPLLSHFWSLLLEFVELSVTLTLYIIVWICTLCTQLSLYWRVKLDLSLDTVSFKYIGYSTSLDSWCPYSFLKLLLSGSGVVNLTLLPSSNGWRSTTVLCLLRASGAGVCLYYLFLKAGSCV